MLKVCVYTDSSKNAQNRQKMAKIGTLSLVRRVPGFSVFSAVRFLKRLKRENNFAVLAHISSPKTCIYSLLQN